MLKLITLLLFLLSSQYFLAQTDFPALKQQFLDYRKADLQDSALLTARKINQLALKEQTDTSFWYAESFWLIGDLYYELRELDSALIFLKRCENSFLSQNRDNTIILIQCLQELSFCFEAISQFKKSEKYLNLAIELSQKYFPENKELLGVLYINTSSLYSIISEFTKAEDEVMKALKIFEFDSSKYYDEYQVAKFNLARLKHFMGDYENSILIINKDLNLKRSDNNLKADTYNLLGINFWSLEQLDSAILYLKKAVDIYKLSDDTFNIYLAGCFENLALCYSDKGDYVNAFQYFKKAIPIYEFFYSEKDLVFADFYTNVGNVLLETNEYVQANDYFQKSSEIYLDILGPENLDYSMSLMNLAISEIEMFDLDNVNTKLDSAYKIRIKLLKKNHPSFSVLYRIYGDLNSALGKTQNAFDYYELSLKILNKNYKGFNYENFSILNSLSLLYIQLGDFSKAQKLLLDCKRYFEDTKTTSNTGYISVLMNIGFNEYNISNYEESKKNYELALQALNNLDTNFNQKFILESKANLNNHLGNIYFEQKEFDLSKEKYLESLHYYRMISNNELDSINPFANLFLVDKEIGDYKAAVIGLSQVSSILSKYGIIKQDEYIETQNNLSEAYYLDNNFSKSFEIKEGLYNIKVEKIQNDFLWLSALERNAYWNKENSFFQDINSFKTIDSIKTISSLKYNSTLFSKCLLLETSRELDQAISNSNDSTLKAQFSEIKQLRTIVIQMQSEGSENREVMERYRTQADSLDKILVNSVGEYTASKRKFEITWKDVQLNLSAKDAAIEFARYFDDKDSSYKYMALVVRPDYDYPKLVNLGEERDIRNAAKNRDFSYLYDLIWKDIDTLLNGVQTVYYSPAGELNNISFVAMCFEAGDSVMTANAQKRGVIISSESEKRQGCSAVLLDKYSLQQLTTTRYLADGSLNNNKPLNTSLTLYGGINYDALPLQSETFSNEMTNEDYAFQVNLTKSINRSETLGTSRKKRSSSSSGKNMDYLPGTLQEVSNISTLMQDNQWLVQTRSDKKAGELILKKDVEIQAPGILHIATHGFSFPDEAKKETSTMHLEKSTIYNASENPMVRCGLMLSGSNISWTGNPQKMLEQTGEDGILTAAEVANLDLSNTKLVVLSACETGLGKIEGSEGTFGLKRGFKLAGVEQLIVSLWSVPDKETMELMTLFYTDLAQTLNPVISFEKAQKEMRNRYPTEPDKWAGFVLVR